MSHYKGSCLCGGVTFEIDGDVRDVLACHCIQCRKTTGNYMSATACEKEQLKLTSDETLAWYESTPGHKRGFCNRCGSSLFWQPDDRNYLAICAGTIDGKLGKKLAGHIYCDFAGDYYEISGGDFQKGER
jgi:hypothetical protein